MKESLEHHIEEEKEIFKKGHKSFERETAVLMAEKVEILKDKYLKELHAGKKLKQPPSHSLAM